MKTVIKENTGNNSKYYDKLIEGYLCTFSSDKHICVSVLFATGMDKNEWIKFKERMLGSVDPSYNN